MSNSSKNISQLMKSTGVFAIGTFGSKILTLIVIPLCTHYINPEGMGIYDMLYTIVALLQPIAVTSVPESLFRWMIDEDIDRRKVFSSWAVLFCGLLVVSSGIYWCIWLACRFENAVIIYLLVVFGCIYLSAQYGTRGLHNNSLFAIQGILYSLVYCVLSFVFVAIMQIGYVGLLIAMLVATVSGTVCMIVAQPELRSFSAGLVDRRYSAEMFRYSIFLLPNQLSWWALSWIGRIFIVGFLGYAANGIFSVAMKFPSAVTMVTDIFLKAWQEQAVGLFRKTERDAWFTKVFRTYSRGLLSMLFIGVPLTRIFIDVVMDSAYAASFGIVTPLYLGAVFSAFASFYGVFYLCARDTRGVASTTIWGGAANAIGSVALIPAIGITGAAFASMIGNFIVWLLRIRDSEKFCSLRINWVEIALLVTGVAVQAVIVNHCSLLSSVLLLMLGAAAALTLNRHVISTALSVLTSKK